MGEFASKGVAGTGLGLGIAGTALGVLAGSNNGSGLLGGLFGGGNQISTLQSEIAQLKSEKYADNVGIETYKQTAADNRDLGDRILGNWVKPLAQESAANRERLASLEAKVDGNKALSDKDLELMRKDIEISNLRMNAKVDAVTAVAHSGIAANSNAIAALQNLVNGITCTKVCKDSICPEVMPRYNSWVAPTSEAPATQPVTGSVKAM